LPAWRSFNTAMTRPMSYMPAAPVSFTMASIAARASSSDICCGR
jgi:hypothetical protein